LLWTSTNADEVIVRGAAMEATILVDNPNVGQEDIGVIPCSLGVETIGGVMTRHDNQEYAEVRIFEGERPLTPNNQFIAAFHLTGLPRGPRGTVEIDVGLISIKL
jgi:heat shock protein 5